MDRKENYAIAEVLYRLNVGSNIPGDLLEKAFNQIFKNNNLKTRDTQLGALIVGLMSRGPTIGETCALLNCAFKLDGFSPQERKEIKLPKGNKLIGAVGSGKKGVKTMNISTPALLTAASLGIFTAKPVSSATSSMTGSADLLRTLDVKIDIPAEEMGKVIRKTGFGAFPIETLLPKFDSVYGRKFFAPTPFSFALPALASPVKFGTFLYGLAHPNIELSVKVLKSFGVENVMVASTSSDGIHYLDEMGVYGTTKILGMRGGEIGRILYFNPVEKLKLPHYTPLDIAEAGSTSKNVKLVIDALKGRGSKARTDIICINAGTLLYLANKAEGLVEGYKLAKDAMKDGLPYRKLLEVIDATGGDKKSLTRFT